MEPEEYQLDIADLLKQHQAMLEQIRLPVTSPKRELVQLLEPFFDRIIEVARGACAGHEYGPAEFQAEVEPLCARMAMGVIPNAVEAWDEMAHAWTAEHPSLQGVLNAGWSQRLVLESAGQELVWSFLATANQAEKGLEAVDKAIELVEVARLWDEAR